MLFPACPARDHRCREAETQEDAVLSAIHDVESAEIGARVLRVSQDDDWLTGSEIAKGFAGLARASGYLSVAIGGPADFRPPWLATVCRTRCGAGLKSKHGSSDMNPRPSKKRGSRLSPDFLAELNDRLDLRERLLHSPNAPWRPKLAEALPLGA
jgi:hypothetical protein